MRATDNYGRVLSKSYADFLELPPATDVEMRAAFAEQSTRIPIAGRLILAHSALKRAGRRATCPEIWQAVQDGQSPTAGAREVGNDG